ncbi:MULTISPECIES: IS110 family transposase [unclassified Streptomyces]|uniref:IS110 family transposase n=1 Tax=unclassified Streptomyces TaxID=2593676 RepID=UPI0033CE2ED5
MALTSTLPSTNYPLPVAPELILGVDTHKDIHVAALITNTGILLGHEVFAADSVGYRQLTAWVRSHGPVNHAGVECTGSYGAGLTRHLRDEGITVTEVNQPDKAARRRHGKSDPVDAEAAARAVLSGRATAIPKSADGPAEDLRAYKIAKDSAVKARTQTINQLKAVLVTAPSELRERLSPLSNPRLIAACADLNVSPSSGAIAYTLRLPARRIQNLTAEVRDLTRRMTITLHSHAPKLLEIQGVGPDSAAALLVAAGDNPERFSSEASFAALCGVSPVERSSGKTHRRRLNRGGDRQANAALYRITQSRLRWDPRTQAYLERRTRDGKSRREIIRCLKRYIAREIYRHLQSTIAINAASETAA